MQDNTAVVRLQPCELCHPRQDTAIFDPSTLCRYHRAQYEYSQQQRVQEVGPEGIRFKTPREP